jgi:hypothetical protein
MTTVARADTSPELKLALSDYDKLRTANDTPAVTVVDLVRVTGSFQKQDLAVELRGRHSGQPQTIPVLSGLGGLRLYACAGDAIVSRADDAFNLTPLAPTFTVRCRIAGVGSDRIELQTTAAVLWLESAVSDGELAGSDTAKGSLQSSIVRVNNSAADFVKPTAVAHYSLSLRPDETRFRYVLDVRNPNRVRAPFDVTLRSGEHVQGVDSRAAFELKETQYRFELPPGEGSIVLSGILPKDSFTAPLDASVQYVLLEAHPLLRPTVAVGPKRISPSETGLTAEFRGAQAFLLTGTQTLQWTVARLEALRTASFSVPDATHTFFVTREGQVLGESALSLDNQGAADITLPVKAEPTFASIGGDPVLLTKNQNGDLWTPLSQGKQSMLVQYRDSLWHQFGLAFGRLPLPQVSAPTTAARIELRYPGDWVPLFEHFQSDSRLWEPALSSLVISTGLGAWVCLLLIGLGLPLRRAIVLGSCAGAAAFCADWAMWGIAGLSFGLSVLWQLNKERRLSPGLIILAVVVGFGTVFWTLTTSSVRGLASDAVMKGGKLASYGEPRGSGSAAPADASASPVYQGLPARITMPAGESTTSFSADMLVTDYPRTVTVLLIRHGIATTLGSLIAFVLLLFFLRDRSQIRRGLTQMTSHFLGKGQESAPAPV